MTARLVVMERGLEGLVAKRLSRPYRPGERDWIKVKNRGYWRYGLELEGMRKGGVAGVPRSRNGHAATYGEIELI
jgi:ATP-dependent DNA ligase